MVEKVAGHFFPFIFMGLLGYEKSKVLLVSLNCVAANLSGGRGSLYVGSNESWRKK